MDGWRKWGEKTNRNMDSSYSLDRFPLGNSMNNYLLEPTKYEQLTKRFETEFWKRWWVIEGGGDMLVLEAFIKFFYFFFCIFRSDIKNKF